MNVFASMLLDSYRELNSKRLFWVILAISGLVVLTYGSIGFNDTGMSMFFGLTNIENEFLTKDSILSKILYRSIFASFILGIWLAWIATILALISTTSIFPDFIAGGAIDLTLSKPIRRVTLFFYKYLASFLFVLLQVSVFCIGIFLCMGIRLDDWEWKIFAAIPVLMLFFSYLFSVNVLLGVWTRSALAALLLTMLFWVSLWSVNATDAIMRSFVTTMEIQVEKADERISELQGSLAVLEDSTAEDDSGRFDLQQEIESQEEERDEILDTMATLERWHAPIRVAQRVGPKTGETIGLLDRWLSRHDDLNIMDIMSGNVAADGSGGFSVTDTSTDREAQARLQEEFRGRSEVYLIGTSLAFEFVVLGLACWIFCRRDY